MKFILKGINITLILGLVAVAAFTAYITFPQFGNQALVVRSGSMTPTIGVGDIVAVSQKPSYKVGDIIAFKSEKNSNTIITHRITERIEGENTALQYKTKGDANEEVDNWTVTQDRVLGKAFITVPSAGRVIAFAKSDIGFPVLIIAPAVFVILLEIISIFKEVRRNRRKNKEDLTYENPKPFGFVVHDRSKWHNLQGLRAIIALLLATALFIPSTIAGFEDNETSTDNLFQAASDFTVTITPTPTGAEEPEEEIILINEVSSDGSSAGEWVELYNPTNSPIDISGWIIEDGASPDVIPLLTPPIPGGGYAVVITNNSTVSGIPGSAITIVIPNGNIGSGLNDDGDVVTLNDETDTFIDGMSYGSNETYIVGPNAPTTTAQTLSRNPNGSDTDTGADWILDTSPSIGVSN